MTTCGSCFETSTTPVALPCSHKFCSKCITNILNSKPCTAHHWCPTCHSPFTVLNNSPPPSEAASFPKRKLYPAHETHTHDSGDAASECARIREENLALKAHAAMWRRRAEAHAAATLGLLNLARVSRSRALEIKAEHEDLSRRYGDLKRNLECDKTERETFPFCPSNFVPGAHPRESASPASSHDEPSSPLFPGSMPPTPSSLPAKMAYVKLEEVDDSLQPPPKRQRKYSVLPSETPSQLSRTDGSAAVRSVTI